MSKLDGVLIYMVPVVLMLLGIVIIWGRLSEDNTKITEVTQENLGYYCNIEYKNLDDITPEIAQENKLKCNETAKKLFGSDNTEQVLIRYKKIN